RRLHQSVFLATGTDELPESAGGRPGYGTGHKATLRLRRVEEFSRKPLFIENAVNHVAIASASAVACNEGTRTAFRGEIANVREYSIVQFQRELAATGENLFERGRLELRIDGE